MKSGLALMVTLAWFCAISTCARAAEPDLIFDPRVDAPVSTRPEWQGFIPVVVMPKAGDPTMGWLYKTSAVVSQIIGKFMANLVPDSNGIDHPVPDENPIDQFVAQMGNSKFQYLIQGVGNLKVLNGSYFYNELQGGVGVEYDLIGKSANILEDQTDTLVVLRVTPLYGEVAYIRLAAGAQEIANLPSRTMLGSSFGFEAMKRIGRFEPGVRAYVRPLIEVDGAHDTGVSIETSIYCRFKLAEMHWLDPTKKANLYLTPSISYYDRGTAQADLAGAQEPGLYRSVAELRRVWIGLLNLEIRI